MLYGTPTPYEVEFAEMLRQAIPDLERIRFVNSGTEAVDDHHPRRPRVHWPQRKC